MTFSTMMLAFFVKHFICDFPLQSTPWMYRNKGSYGHIGGITHAAIHGYGTGVVLAICGAGNGDVLGMAAVDMVVHYHIDWAKMRLGVSLNLKPDNSEWFWILLGFDQLLHYLTYWFICFEVLR